MRILGVDHIGIAVASLETALEFYVGSLGLRAGPIEERAEHGLRLVNVYAPNATLELIEAKDWKRTTQRHQERQGPGIYHVGLRVDGVDAALEELRRQQVRLIDEVPREGPVMRIAYIHPDASGQALVELVERKALRP
jgi:methylmalonyl-CoA epimerase